MAGGSADDDAATRAERIFDSLLEHAVAARNGQPVANAKAQPVVLSPPSAATTPAQPAPAATNGDLGGADPIGRLRGTTGAEILVRCQAMEHTLEAINRRLTSIERILLGEPGPNAGSAEQTMARLRLTLLRSAGRPERTNASLPEVEVVKEEEEEEETTSVPEAVREVEAKSVPEVEAGGA